MRHLSKFADHLEFLGYRIEPLNREANDSPEVAMALHPNLNNLILLADRDSFVLFIQVRLNFSRHVNLSMYEYLDEVNGNTNVSRAYIDEEKSQLVLQTHFTGDYNKAFFSEFMNLFGVDQQLLVSLNDFEKIWA